MTAPSNGPLSGLRILDIATIVAAPSAAALLADYGAEVLKLEMPGAGDGARGFPPFKDGNLRHARPAQARGRGAPEAPAAEV